MQKLIITIVVLFIAAKTLAQEKSQEKEIKNVITKFFDGLHKGDSAIVASTLHKEINIQTTSTQKNGVKILKTDSKLQLLSAIANKKPTAVYLEKLLSITINIDGNLASVWTPYEFYFNGNFSHCGANSFQLFNNNGKWQIIYLVDMRRRDHCKYLEDKK